MSKFRLACVATAVWASATGVEAFKAQVNSPEHEGTAQTFKCKSVEQGQSRIMAADPPRTVIVSLTLTDKKVTEFKVLYVDDNGERSSPADETKSWRLVTIPGSHDYNWYAIGGQRPNLLVHGRLVEQYGARDGENRWLYDQEEFEHGIKTVDYQAVCVKEGKL